MASSPEDRQKPQSDNQSISESNHNTDRAATQPQEPVTGYPLTMGYLPPPMGYANPHSTYQPSYSSYNPHPAEPPSLTAYGKKKSREISTCARAILYGLTFLATIMCLTSLFTWLVLRPEIPKFHLNGLLVSNFNVTGTFTARWDANVTVDNTNHKLRAYFDKIRTAMYYKQEPVSMSAIVDPFNMETKTKNTMSIKLATNNTEQSIVETALIQKMKTDWNDGMVIFDLKITMGSMFKAKTWGERHSSMKVNCDHILVLFSNGSSNGKVSGGNSVECSVS